MPQHPLTLLLLVYVAYNFMNLVLSNLGQNNYIKTHFIVKARKRPSQHAPFAEHMNQPTISSFAIIIDAFDA